MKPEDQRLLDRLPPDRHELNGVPKRATARDRKRAVTVIRRSLAEFLRHDGIRFSPLGPEWSRDVDAYVTEMPPWEQLELLGWLPLDGVLRALGSSGRGRWIVVEGDRPLGLVDFHVGPPPERVAALLDRCRRQRRVRLREVLELRSLVREGHMPPPHDPITALAARIESGMGGALLAGWLNGRAIEAPAELGAPRLRALARKAKRLFRRRIVVAVSGVDGAGKSSLCSSLVEALAKAAIPTSIVWTRPGMRLRVLGHAAGIGKRVLGQDAEPGVRSVAEGPRAGELASRRGLVGWVWSLLVTIAFLFDVRRRHMRAGGVVVYDRHMLDALATLHFAYEGVNLRMQAALIRMFLPRASLTLFLKVPAGVAVARKPTDVIGEHAVDLQLKLYDRFRRDVREVHELDATSAPAGLTMAALSALTARWPDAPADRRPRAGGR